VIWIDTSFAVEWLCGTERASQVNLPRGPLGLLSMQYAEVYVFFLRKGMDHKSIAGQLDFLELGFPEKIHLQLAAQLYIEARVDVKNKASLADALLAAVAYERKEKIIAFDRDFSSLGFEEEEGIWHSIP